MCNLPNFGAVLSNDRTVLLITVNYPKHGGGLPCPICKDADVTYCPKCHTYTCHNPKCPKHPYNFTFKEGVLQT